VAWRFTRELEDYVARVWDLLARDPAEQTVALSVIESTRAGRAWDGAPVFGWFEDGGGVSGAVLMTPPFELLLAVVPDGAAEALAAALREHGVAVPGVNGEPGLVARFAAAWTDGTALPARPSMRQGLYRLGTLAPPDPPPPGRARVAAPGDRQLAMGFIDAFQAEAGAHGTDPAEWFGSTQPDGRVWLWEDAGGSVTAMAGRTATSAGVARIAPVYTPPEHRRRGYGAAVTAACSADALARGAGHVVLFADRANATSNRVYQRIGFERIAEREVVRFG
jgi:ribosomal protein S18 acetylase RimI-like enzyme